MLSRSAAEDARRLLRLRPRRFWHKETRYAKHGALRMISSALVRLCIARLFAASSFRVRTGDAKRSYGRTLLLVRPVAGTGEQWVEESRVMWNDGKVQPK